MTTTANTPSAVTPSSTTSTSKSHIDSERTFSKAIHSIEEHRDDLQSIRNAIQSIHSTYPTVKQIIDSINNRLYDRWIYHIIKYTFKHPSLHSLIQRYYTFDGIDNECKDESDIAGDYHRNLTATHLSIHNLHTCNTILQSWKYIQALNSKENNIHEIRQQLYRWTLPLVDHQRAIHTILLTVDATHDSTNFDTHRTNDMSSRHDMHRLSHVQLLDIIHQICTLPDTVLHAPHDTPSIASIPSPLRHTEYYKKLCRNCIQHAAECQSKENSGSYSVAACISKLCRIGFGEFMSAGVIEYVHRHLHDESHTIERLRATVRKVGLNELEMFIESLLKYASKTYKLRKHATSATSAPNDNDMNVESIAVILYDIRFGVGDDMNSTIKQQSHIHYLLSNKLLCRRNLPVTQLYIIVDILYYVSTHSKGYRAYFLPSLTPIHTNSDITQTGNQHEDSTRLEHNTPLDDALIQLSKVWSTTTFIQYTAHHIQHTIALVLQHMLHYYKLHNTKMVENMSAKISDNELMSQLPFSSHEALSYLLSGVTNAMSSNVQQIRVDTMNIAVMFSAIIDPQNPIKFNASDDNEDDEDDTDNQRGDEDIDFHLAADQDAVNPNNVKLDVDDAIFQNRMSHDGAIERKEMDHSALQSYTKFIHKGNDTAGMSALEAINKEEDDNYSDLRKVPLPLYVRDVIDYLSKHDDRHRITAALDAATSVIEKHPYELYESGMELCRALVNIGTAPLLDSNVLNIKRLSAIEALTVSQVHTIVPYLSTQIYSTNMTLESKLALLRCLSRAAQRLAHVTEQQSVTSTTSGTNHNKSNQETESGTKAVQSLNSATALTLDQHRAIVDKRIESKTHRFTKTRGSKKNDTKDVNEFLDVAPIFFYTLLYGYTNGESDQIYTNDRAASGSHSKAIHGMDATLLVAIIDALSIYCMLLSKHLLISEFAKNLYNTILTISRLHHDASVRSVTLLSISRLMIALPDIQFVDTFTYELNDMIDWLISVCKDDVSEDCVKYAQAALYGLKDAVGRTFHKDQHAALSNQPERKAEIRLISQSKR